MNLLSPLATGGGRGNHHQGNKTMHNTQNWYHEQKGGIRQYTTTCHCSDCWLAVEQDDPKTPSTPNAEPQENTKFVVDEQERNHEDTVAYVWSVYGEDTGLTKEQISQVLAVLRVGDFFTTDEFWANKNRCVRIS